MNTTSTRTVVPLWEPGIVLPSQVTDRRRAALSPEMRLVTAMFEDAVRSVVRNADARGGPRRREFEEARGWLLDDARDWPFAFANVCDLLGLDAAAVRRSLFCHRRARQEPRKLTSAQPYNLHIGDPK